MISVISVNRRTPKMLLAESNERYVVAHCPAVQFVSEKLHLLLKCSNELWLAFVNV